MVRFNSIDEVPEHIKAKLANYFTNVGGDTFVIHGLPPELTGGAMARYSRAATGLQLTLANEFLDEEGNPSSAKGTELMDRVLNAFGDDSVGELEGVASGIENISQIATKGLEDRRIGGSPIEQSTRYVRYDQKRADGKWRYLRPREVVESGLLTRFEETNDLAFDVYSKGVQTLQPLFERQLPRDRFEIEVTRGGEKVRAKETELVDDAERRAFRQAYSFTIRCAALDVGRCVLPSSALTHIGISGNGRYWSTVLNHLKSSDLAEERERAESLEIELKKVIPTFVKRNARSEHAVSVRREMERVSKELFRGITPTADSVNLVQRGDYRDEVLASALFPYTNIALPQILEVVRGLGEDKKTDIMKAYVGNRKSRRDRSGRGLEAGYPLTYDLVGGFAEYRDLERHRMLTQQRQALTTDLGFILPPEMTEVGLEDDVKRVVASMENLHSDLKHAGLGAAAQYATLFNNRLRFMMGMNLREFQHLGELRTQPAGHFSYRAMVQEMARAASTAYPWAKEAYGFIDWSDSGNKITRAKEQGKIAGRNLASGVESLDLD